MSEASENVNLVGLTIVSMHEELDIDGDEWRVLTFDDGRVLRIRHCDRDPSWVWVHPSGVM